MRAPRVRVLSLGGTIASAKRRAGGVLPSLDADALVRQAGPPRAWTIRTQALRRVRSGDIGLDDQVQRYLPDFDGPGKDRVTVRQLLAHTSGLPAFRPYHECVPKPDPAQARAAALAEPLISAPGSTCCYSDIGFIALGELCAAVAGCGLDQLVRELVLGPLGMDGSGYRPSAGLAGRIAATEHVAGLAKIGVVHDENAEALGGISGHAGLFGTVSDLAKYAGAWAAGESGPAEALGLPGWLRAEALRCQTDGLAGRRGLGWGLRRDRWDNMGDGWPATGAGHTGFTGTSLSIDPASGMWAVVLTNAVHFGRGPEHSVVGLRKQVHASIAAALLGGAAPVTR